MTKSANKQHSVTIGFNKEQYKQLLKLAIDANCLTVYALLKLDIIKLYNLPNNRLVTTNQKTLKQQLMELKGS